jgi:hypothetical protein
VQHREHDDHLVRCPKVNCGRESVQKRSANIAGHCGELEWPLADARERPIDVAEESIGEAGTLIVVPPRGILEISLGEWAER